MDDGDLGGRLLPREEVLSWGRPKQGLLLLARDGYAIPFMLAWCGIVAVGVVSESGKSSVMGMAILSVMTVIGIFGLAGRYVIDAWLRSNTIYALTSQRIVIARARPFAAFLALDLDRLPPLELIEGANGRGTIRFGRLPAEVDIEDNPGWWLPVLDRVPQFLAIADARQVFDQIQQAAGGRP